MLLLAIIYMLLRQREATNHSQSVTDRVCPYCDFESSANGYANVSRSLSAHIRQMHPTEWRHLRTAGSDTH